MVPRFRTVALFLLGIALLSIPAGPDSGVRGEAYYVSIAEADEPIDGEVRPYEELPPAAQRAIDRARAGDSVTLYEHPDRRAIEALRTSDYVRIDGTYYRTSLTSPAENGTTTFGEFLDRFVVAPLLLLGGFLVAVALVTERDRDWQPDTLRRVGAVIGPAWVAVLLWVTLAVYAATGLWFPDDHVRVYVGYAGVFIPGLLFLLVGSALQRGDRTLAAVAALPALSFALVGLASTMFLFAFLIVLVIGLPMLGVGYWLTDPPT